MNSYSYVNARSEENEELLFRWIRLCQLRDENREKVNEIKGVKQATVNFTTCKLTIEKA